MPTSLADRLRALVEVVYEGSANSAAAAIGVPQPTLHKILAGTSESPRVNTLMRIAAHFETSVDWLLTGSGRAPECLEAPAATAQLLDSLELSERARAQVLGLSALFRNVDDALAWRERIGDAPEGMDAQLTLYGKLRRRGRLVDEAIAATIEAFILKVGESRARERLEDPEVSQLLAAVQHPLDRVGRTRVQAMEEIAAQARQPRAGALSQRPAARKRR